MVSLWDADESLDPARPGALAPAVSDRMRLPPEPASDVLRVRQYAPHLMVMPAWFRRPVPLGYAELIELPGDLQDRPQADGEPVKDLPDPFGLISVDNVVLLRPRVALRVRPVRIVEFGVVPVALVAD